MEKFEFSERYRKYVMEIIIKNNSFYTVWGTDMADNECDKVLVEDEKCILFCDIRYLKVQVAKYASIFLDSENVSDWIKYESLEDIYNTFNLDVLFSFELSDLSNKEKSYQILNGLNLLQDFYIQIRVGEKLFESNELYMIKDFIYNSHFWNHDEQPSIVRKNDILKAKKAIKKIEQNFLSSLSVIYDPQIGCPKFGDVVFKVNPDK